MTFLLFKTKGQAKNYLKSINAIKRNIQFTLEEERTVVLVFWTQNCLSELTIYTNWHLKETNTCVYIPRSAYCPLSYKKAAIRSLIY